MEEDGEVAAGDVEGPDKPAPGGTTSIVVPSDSNRARCHAAAANVAVLEVAPSPTAPKSSMLAMRTRAQLPAAFR